MFTHREYKLKSAMDERKFITTRRAEEPRTVCFFLRSGSKSQRGRGYEQPVLKLKTATVDS